MRRDRISFRQDSVRDRGYSAFELSIAVQIILPSPATSIFPEKRRRLCRLLSHIYRKPQSP